MGNGVFALVSDKDYARVNQYKWYLLKERQRRGGPYARRNKPTHMYMHNFILGVKGVDHKNHNGLDNRRSNLRRATQSQNNANQGLRRNNTSGAKGVSWDKVNRKWLVQIRKNYRRCTIGRFDSIEEAAKAYNRKAKELFGEFAK